MRKRVLSGMRPTGKLHLGNLFGSLEQWKELSKDNECFFMVADLHALTTDFSSPQEIKENIEDMIIDWLAVGIQEDAVIFRQSDIPFHTQLHFILSCITPLGWLERNPTYKDLKRELQEKDLNNYGFLGYPVLQAADILLYKAQIIPVGEDQLPHIEITREIARRFNHLYGNIFVLPEARLSEAPRVLGVDGRKMSKSYQNCIYLCDESDEIRQKVFRMVTDTHRKIKKDPGEPSRCPLFSYFELPLIREKEYLSEIVDGCRKATRGCVECKELLSEILIEYLKDIRQKRKDIELNKEIIYQILEKGKERAYDVAQKVYKGVKEAVGL